MEVECDVCETHNFLQNQTLSGFCLVLSRKARIKAKQTKKIYFVSSSLQSLSLSLCINIHKNTQTDWVEHRYALLIIVPQKCPILSIRGSVDVIIYEPQYNTHFKMFYK